MLEDCLKSVKSGKGNLAVQIIVVDNGSTDGSLEMIRRKYSDVLLIESGENLGFAKANNLAIKFVKSPLILFLNSDTIIQEKALTGMVNFLDENPSVGAVGCKIRDNLGKVQELPTQWLVNPLAKFMELMIYSEKTIPFVKHIIPYQDPEQSGYVKYLYGACLMVRRKAFIQAGYFDDRFFMYCEDVDLCYRIRQKNFKIYYLSNYAIIHLVGGSTKTNKNELSTQIMCDSISKLAQKYYGYFGLLGFKAAVLVAVPFRLFLIMLFKLFNYIGAKNRGGNSEAIKRKYLAMIKWSLSGKSRRASF